MSSVQRQSITLIHTDLLIIGALRPNFSGIWIHCGGFHSNKYIWICPLQNDDLFFRHRYDKTIGNAQSSWVVCTIWLRYRPVNFLEITYSRHLIAHPRGPNMRCIKLVHGDVIKWKHLPRHWPFVRGIHRSPVNSPHKGQWRGALMFSWMWAETNGSANSRYAGDLRRHGAHYDFTAKSRSHLYPAGVLAVLHAM